MSDRDKPAIPDVLLERYRLGEMSPEDRAALQRRLATDSGSVERLTQLESSDRDIETQHPAEWLAARVRARLSERASLRRRSRTVRAVSWSAALASAAAVLVVVARVWQPLGPPEAPMNGDRIKGLQPSLALFRKTAGGSEPLEDGARARAGDVVRLAYRAAGRGYGIVLSIDGRGVVTLHLPPAGSRAVELRSGTTMLLDQAYELDDAPRFERFYLVASARPFDLEPVLRAARRAAASSDGRDPAALPLPSGFEQSTFLLAKEESR